jgi:hypothetical protein
MQLIVLVRLDTLSILTKLTIGIIIGLSIPFCFMLSDMIKIIPVKLSVEKIFFSR